MLWSVLGVVLMGGLAAFLTWERHDMARALIYGELRGKRASNIRITPQWFDADRDTLSFDVAYTDSQGRVVHARCKVASHPGADQSIYWTEAS